MPSFQINKAHRTMLRALARARKEAKATQSCPSSDPLPPPSPPTSASLFTSWRERTRSTRPRSSPSQSPTSSHTPSSSPSHSSQSSRSSSQSREDTLCSSSSSVASAPIPPCDSFINTEISASDKNRDALREKCNHTFDFNPKTFLRRPEDPPTCNPDFVGDTLRPDRSILRGAGADAPRKWVHVLNMTLEEIYQGKTFHFRLVRYRLSGKKNIVPLDVSVPLGSRDGTEVIVTNVGNERKDGTRQDIVFLVKALKHKRFSRVRDDLRLEVRLPWVDSLNDKEGEVRFVGIDGKEYVFHVGFCKTRLLSGTTIIPNAGMPHCAGDGRGRIVVRSVFSNFFFRSYQAKPPIFVDGRFPHRYHLGIQSHMCSSSNHDQSADDWENENYFT